MYYLFFAHVKTPLSLHFGRNDFIAAVGPFVASSLPSARGRRRQVVFFESWKMRKFCYLNMHTNQALEGNSSKKEWRKK